MKLSIAMCTYNAEKFLKQQLESIVQQVNAGDEILICDDGSTDNTIDIVSQFSKDYKGLIKLYTNQTNLGAKKNFEKALSLCTGDIIFLSDQDDVWLADKVKTIEDYFENNPDKYGVFSNGLLISEEGSPQNKTLWDASFFDADVRSFINKEHTIFKHILLYRNVVTGATLAIKKEVKEAILPFKFMDRMWHDMWIALVLSANNQLGWIEKPLIAYRLHANQQAGLINEQESVLIKSAMINDLKGNLSLSEAAADIWRRRKVYFLAKDIKLALPQAYPIVKEALYRYHTSRSAYLKQFSFIGRLLRRIRFFYRDKF